jgi:hypothetical protein
MGRQRGQAQIELIAGVPILLLAGLIVLQLLAVGYAQSLADGAAEAGAIAAADGRAGVEDSARAALPGWADERVHVSADGGEVSVELEPPALLPGVSSHLEVSSSAYARPAADAPG